MSESTTEVSGGAERVCEAQGRTRQFLGYAFGDPLPIYATFATDENGDDMVLIVTCQRPAGHGGPHATKGLSTWSDGDERIRDQGDD